jgi:hypothetical protein
LGFGAPAGGSLFSNTAATSTAAASAPPPTGTSLFGGGATTSFGQGFSFANPGGTAAGTNIFQQPDKPLFSATPGAFLSNAKK